MQLAHQGSAELAGSEAMAIEVPIGREVSCLELVRGRSHLTHVVIGLNHLRRDQGGGCKAGAPCSLTAWAMPCDVF